MKFDFLTLPVPPLITSEKFLTITIIYSPQNLALDKSLSPHTRLRLPEALRQRRRKIHSEIGRTPRMISPEQITKVSSLVTEYHTHTNTQTPRCTPHPTTTALLPWGPMWGQ